MNRPAAIPCCLAATGFLAALTVFGWQGRRNDPGQGVDLQAAMGYRFTPAATDHRELRSAQAPAVAAAAPAEDAPPTLTLPLPPATQPEPVPNVQPVPDDQPTVDDLPAPHTPPESPEP